MQWRFENYMMVVAVIRDESVTRRNSVVEYVLMTTNLRHQPSS